jgi:hypothetical protein
MTRRRYLQFATGVFWASRRALGSPKGEFVVIVHISNRFDVLSRAKVSNLFLRRVSRWPWGAEVVPVDLASVEPTRREFTLQVLQMSGEQLAAYWIDQRATRGVSPPMEVRDAAAAKHWVAARPGAIGYIPLAALDETVKAVHVDA